MNLASQKPDTDRLAEITALLALAEGQSLTLDPEMPEGEKHVVADNFERELDEDVERSPDEEAEIKKLRAEQERELILDALGSDLQRKVEERVNQRRPVENRWLQDLRQYHAKYDPDVEKAIKDAKGSEVFVNVTGPKTDGFAARMADMILPTDGKNWSIKPTPSPELGEAMQSEEQLVDPATGQPQADPKTGEPVQARDLAKGIQKVAAERCAAMEKEIDDQLSESKYNAVQRAGIDQVAQLGTMVLKGPTIIGRTRRVWKKQADATGVVHVAEIIEDRRPAVEHVDVWDFFPDLNSPDPEGWEDVYQRHYMTARQLRELAKQPGFHKGRIRALVRDAGSTPNMTALHFQHMRDITGESATTQIMQRFELWEYHGPITAEQLSACGVKLNTEDGGEFDPLETKDAIVWFCEGVVLKAMLKPEEVQGLGYHVTWVKKDETSPFGFGIPRLMRNSQKVANSAWRMVMDNGGLALAPQIIMAMGVAPADGNWSMYPGKIWVAKEGASQDVTKAMATFDLPMRLTDLLKIFETALKLADEETSMPVIMQGERGPAVPETAEGMAMLFNAASVIQRRFVRLYDDRITKPIITGFYDYNMAHGQNEEIKGDYEVQPLGSSALLEKERYTQNVLAGLNLAASPLVEPRVDIHVLVEEAYKALRLGQVVKDRREADAEVQRRQQAAAQAAQAAAAGKGPQGADPAMVQLKQAELQERAATREANVEMHNQKLAVEIEKLSRTTGLKENDLMAKLGIAKMNVDSANQRFNTEIAVKQKHGEGI